MTQRPGIQTNRPTQRGPSQRTLFRRAAELRAALGLPPLPPGRPRHVNPSPAALRQRACRARKAAGQTGIRSHEAGQRKPMRPSPSLPQSRVKIAA